MTNSVKSHGSKQPSTGHGGTTNASVDQFSIAPSSTITSFKRAGSITSKASKKSAKSAKSYDKVEKYFTMSPRFSLSVSSPPVADTARPEGTGTEGFDPNTRSESIGVQHRLPIGEHLVTQIARRPSAWPTEFKDVEEEYDPDKEGRVWRKQIEAALRMYPRNTWGPTTKWGYLDEVPGNGTLKEKEHFKESNSISNHDKMEKERLAKRDVGFVRHWTKYKHLTHQWEDAQEARQGLQYGEPAEQYIGNAEKMLHAQNDKRIAKNKNDDARRRTVGNTREFTRLERREQEYLKKISDEAEYRRDPGARKIMSSVRYNILCPDFRPPEDMFPIKMKKWRACMRSLRLQSKQSGARMYNVMTWKPQKPCCVPPPKPDPNELPQEIPKEKLPAERAPSPARPRNMLHSLDRLEDVPVGNTQDNRTNW
ncbi:unnamed protein product [Calypogeia fissa]